MGLMILVIELLTIWAYSAVERVSYLIVHYVAQPCEIFTLWMENKVLRDSGYIWAPPEW